MHSNYFLSKRKVWKKVMGLLLVVAMTASLAACGKKEQENKESKAVLNIAYQYGLAYAPLIVAQENKTIEAAYREMTGEEAEVNWIQMSSGADINFGIAAGELNVGFMGIGPAITGVSKKVGYKIFTNVSGQQHGLMVNDKSVQSFSDIIGSDSQIAVVNIGSFQHMVLAMALANEGLDPHALDANLIAMKHPDGMTALTTGGVLGHVTTSPYLFKERGEETLHEIQGLSEAWPKEKSFIVGVAAEKLYSENEKLYQALCKGMQEAIELVGEKPEEAAKLTAAYNGNTVEKETEYLEKGYYSVETNGIGEMAEFMYKNNFVEVNPGNYKDIVFDNVKGN